MAQSGKKLTKARVNYRPARAHARQRCGTCSMLVDGRPRTGLVCTLVAGEIRRGDVCDRWAPR